MKKLIICIILFSLFLAGCSNDSMLLSGKSTHWKGEYLVKLNNNGKVGHFNFSYIKGEINFNKLKVDIQNGEIIRKEKNYNSKTLRILYTCHLCVNSKKKREEPVMVIISWNNKNEETFFLKKPNEY